MVGKFGRNNQNAKKIQSPPGPNRCAVSLLLFFDQYSLIAGEDRFQAQKLLNGVGRFRGSGECVLSSGAVSIKSEYQNGWNFIFISLPQTFGQIEFTKFVESFMGCSIWAVAVFRMFRILSYHKFDGGVDPFFLKAPRHWHPGHWHPRHWHAGHWHSRHWHPGHWHPGHRHPDIDIPDIDIPGIDNPNIPI